MIWSEFKLTSNDPASVIMLLTVLQHSIFHFVCMVITVKMVKLTITIASPKGSE